LSLAGSAGHSRRALTIIDPGLGACGLRGCGLRGWRLRRGRGLLNGRGLRRCGLRHDCGLRHGWGRRGWAVAHPIALPIVSRGSRGRFANRIGALTIVGGSF